MLIMIISAVMIIGGFILLAIYDEDYTCDHEWRLVVGMSSGIIGLIALLICLILWFGARIDPDFQFKQDMVIYETLKYEEENNYITFAEDVIEYNHTVNKYQRWHDDLWIGAFYYEGCENVPYYELKGE